MLDLHIAGKHLSIVMNKVQSTKNYLVIKG